MAAGLAASRAGTSSRLATAVLTKQLITPAAQQAIVRVAEARHHPYLLSSPGSVVTQTKLDEFCRRFKVPRSILMRVPQVGELPHHAHEYTGEIAFPLVAFECEVRLSLALFIRRLLSEFPLHPLQLTPVLWEHCISQCIYWHRIHGQDLSYEELLRCIGIRQVIDKSGTYSPYSSVGRIIGGRAPTLSWQRQWFFLGGPWEISTYGAA